MNDARRDAYLQEVLGLDPAHDAAAIVLRRARHLDARADDASSHTGAAPRPSREEQERQVREVAEHFLRRSRDEVARSLEGLSEIDQPDLRRWVMRLQQAHAAHAELVAFAGDDRTQRSFRERLSSIVVGNPRDAAAVRAEQLRRTSPQLGKQAARTIARDYPQLAALEAQHLTDLRRIARTRRLARTPASIGISFILLWIVIRVIVTLMRGSG